MDRVRRSTSTNIVCTCPTTKVVLGIKVHTFYIGTAPINPTNPFSKIPSENKAATTATTTTTKKQNQNFQLLAIMSDDEEDNNNNQMDMNDPDNEQQQPDDEEVEEENTSGPPVNIAEALAAPSIRGGLSPTAARLFRVYRTIANMLDKRGYMVPKNLREITPYEFRSRFGDDPSRDSLTILVEKADDETNQLFVFFPDDEKVGVKPIKVYTDRMQGEGVTNAIIVLRVDITPFAKQAIQEVSESFRIEHFKETELLVDITKHQLVPTHQVLTNSEKNELLKRYRLKDTQLPRIQQNDPIARYYGMKRGNVVKIIRPSETAGRYVTYRVCM